jgi:SARP family transcriptional regulator, regulator of embCAB operon
LEAPGIRVQLCGRVAIDLGGRRVEHGLPGRQGRLLFVYLAVHRLRAVTRDELAEAVWPGGPPAAWDSALNALLSKLRRLPDADLVPARGDPRLVLPTTAWVNLEAARGAVHRAESAVTLGDWPRAWGAAQVTMFAARRGFLPGEDVAWAEEIRRRSLSCPCVPWRPMRRPRLASAGQRWPPPNVPAASSWQLPLSTSEDTAC